MCAFVHIKHYVTQYQYITIPADDSPICELKLFIVGGCEHHVVLSE